MRKKTALIALLFSVTIPALAAAATSEYDVDTVHSEVGFKVRHLVAKTPGRFNDYVGKVWVDPENVAGSLKLSATIQAASIDTRNERRDTHLRSADFFEVEKYPELKFESTNVKAKGEGTFEVTGDLTMKGITKPITLVGEVVGTGMNPFTGAPMIGLDLTGTLNRKDFNILWNKALDSGGFLLGDEVALEIHLEASVPKAEG